MRERLVSGGKGAGPETLKHTCPYLGLAHDQFGHLPEPSSEHRCYLYMQRERIDQSHQQRFCLTTNYLTCPWLMVSPAAGGQAGSAWQRFTDSMRERFDEMERVTMRNRWPRAFLAVLFFLGQMIVKAVMEAWRVAGPFLRPYLERLWFEVRSYAIHLWMVARRKAAAALSRQRMPRPSSVTRPVPAGLEMPPDTGAVEPLGQQPAMADSLHGEAQPEPATAVSPSRRAAAGYKWECANCFTYNAADVTFCQRCGRLSSDVEAELLSKEDFFTLDGLKALMGGDEEGAHRYFTLATQANSRSELAWRWRSRTAVTLADVISCLEQMVKAIPDSDEAKADLALARERRDREERLAAARAAAVEAERVPPGPTMLQRTLAVVRRLALELASIPSFALGLLWLGKPVLDAFAQVGYYGLGPAMPVFQLPNVAIHLPPSLVEPLLPSTVPLGAVLPIVLAIWYLLLAFSVTEGSNGGRYSAIVSGLVSILAIRYVAANGEAFLMFAVCLFVLGVIGKGGPREEVLNANAMSARVA